MSWYPLNPNICKNERYYPGNVVKTKRSHIDFKHLIIIIKSKRACFMKPCFNACHEIYFYPSCLKFFQTNQGFESVNSSYIHATKINGSKWLGVVPYIDAWQI